MPELNKSADFVSLQLKRSTLKRLLSSHNLHLDDIRCSNCQSKAQLQELLLQSLLLNT